MFDIGASELLVIVVVAILVIGPKDMPRAMRTAGRWVGKMRRVSAHFRTGIDAMIREAELEDMEKQWKAQNEAIMAGTPLPSDGSKDSDVSAEPANLLPDPPSSESPVPPGEPELPLDKSPSRD